MGKFFKAELKDRFLKFAISRDDYFETQVLYNEFLSPHYSLEYAVQLIQEIIDYNDKLLDVMSGNGQKMFMISSTGFTKQFLKNSSFCHLFIQEEEKWDKLMKQMSCVGQLTNEEKSLLETKRRLKLVNQKKWLVLLSAVLGFCLVTSLISIGYIIYSQKRFVTDEQLNEKISNLNHVQSANDKDAAGILIEFQQDSLLVRRSE